MELFARVLEGLTVAMTPINIMWVTLGGFLGTVIGMLPGLGPATGVALLLPLDLYHGTDRGLNYDGRRVLWGNVWRLQSVDPD